MQQLVNPRSGRDSPSPSPRRSYAIAGTDTGTVVGHPICVARLGKAICTCNSVTYVQNFTSDQISGDLVTAVIWSWFAAAESHNRISQNRAGIVENPGLSYGLFHAVANPIYSWGVVRQVKFPGVNMDVGHVRNITWANNNDEKKWVAYNRLRGKYMSALEHAVPERFFNYPNQCNLQGTTTPIQGLPDCPQESPGDCSGPGAEDLHDHAEAQWFGLFIPGNT